MNVSAYQKLILPLIPIILLVSIWYALTNFGFVPSYLLPTPYSVIVSLKELTLNGMFLEHTIASLTRVGISFLCASIFAIPVGILLGWHKLFGSAFLPLIELFRTISPISWIPLAIMWFGIGNEPAIFILFMAGFFPLLISSRNAVYQVDPLLITVAKNLGAHDKDLLLKVILPATVPYLFIALRVSLGIIWVVVVAAEMAGLRSGLGYLILDGRNLLRTDLIIAGMLVIGFIGFLMDWGMSKVEQSLAQRGYLHVK